MNTKSFTFEAKTIEVSKLPIGKYAELLKVITELPKQIKELFNSSDKISNDELIDKIPNLVGTCLPDIVNLIVVACEGQVTKEEVESMGLDEIVDALIAIFEVNNYSSVFNKIKKALSRPGTPVTRST